METAPALSLANAETLSRRTVAVLGLVWLLPGAAYGCILPFLTVYAARRGMTLADIGVLSAVGAAAAGLMQPLLSRLMERTGRGREILVATLAAGALGAAALGVAGTAPLIIACAALVTVGFFCGRVVTIVATVAVLDRAGHGSAMFARFRASPPVGFTLTGVSGGLLLDTLGFRGLFLIGASLFLLTAFAAVWLPVETGHSQTSGASTVASEGDITARRVLITVSLMALLYGIVSSTSDTYAGLLMKGLHGTSFEIGLTSSIITVAEIPLMLLFGRLADGGRRSRLLVLGMAVVPLRYALFSLVRQPLQLLGTQLLDGPAFAAYAVVGVSTLAGQTPREERAWAFAVYSAAGTLGPIAGPLLAGVLAARVGLQPMFGWFAAGSTAIPLVLVAGLWPLLKKR
jgi:MFS family permease